MGVYSWTALLSLFSDYRRESIPIPSVLHRELVSWPRTQPIQPVFIEGPYGASPPPSLHKTNTIIAIAGGIGITSILGYLQLYHSNLSMAAEREDGDLGEGGNTNATRFLLVWAVREESLVKAVEGQIGDLEGLRRRGVEVQIVRTEEGGERMDVRTLVRDEVKCESDGTKRVVVVSCGPGGMADQVRGAVVDCIGEKGVNVELVEESFCW